MTPEQYKKIMNKYTTPIGNSDVIVYTIDKEGKTKEYKKINITGLIQDSRPETIQELIKKYTPEQINEILIDEQHKISNNLNILTGDKTPEGLNQNKINAEIYKELTELQNLQPDKPITQEQYENILYKHQTEKWKKEYTENKKIISEKNKEIKRLKEINDDINDYENELKNEPDSKERLKISRKIKKLKREINK